MTCTCSPRSISVTPSGGSLVHTCNTCGASVIELSGNLPAFTRDEATYEVSVELTPAILKTHLALLKAKSGQPTPRLLELARGNQRLVLMTGRAGQLHYELRELADAGCPICVAPPYPHELV